MDLKKAIKDVEDIPDCETLMNFLKEAQAYIEQRKKELAEEIIELGLEITAGLTPISYVAYQVKKAKEKLERAKKELLELADFVTLIAAVNNKAQKLGCLRR